VEKESPRKWKRIETEEKEKNFSISILYLKIQRMMYV